MIVELDYVDTLTADEGFNKILAAAPNITLFKNL